MLKMTPDAEQQSIISSGARFIAIDGNAGAAKTMTLAMKVADSLGRGLRPGEVLVLTYTPAAVLAFQQRLRWLGLSKERIGALRIQTFDDFCHETLCSLQGSCGLLQHPNRRVHEAVQAGIQKARDLAVSHDHGDAFDIVGDGTLAIPALLKAFRLLKGTLALQSLGNEFRLTPGSASDAGLDFTQVAVMRAYERIRLEGSEVGYRDSAAPTFRLTDDPIYDIVCLLTADDSVYGEHHPLSGQAKLVLIDEGHDVNAASFTVLQHLVQQNPVKQLLIVGDIDQVVHSDSGADAAFMREQFERGIGPLQRFPLTTCRRFGEELALPLEVHAGKPYAFEPMRDTVVRVVRSNTTADVATVIQGAFNQAGGPGGGLAVLVRHPGDAVGLEIELAERGFLVETRGFERFYDRPEVLFVRALVAWATNNLDTLAQADVAAIASAFGEFTGCLSHASTRHVVVRDMTVLSAHFLGNPESLDGFGLKESERPIVSFADVEARRAIGRLLRIFAAGVHTRDFASRVDDVGLSPLLKRGLVNDEDVEDAVLAIHAFAATSAAYPSFGPWLQQMSNLEFSAKAKGRADGDLVRLYSIPAAKGLEFSHVVMPDIEAGRFDGQQQEERNLFYVGASRARDRLTMTYRRAPSSYLSAFGRESDWIAG